MITNWLGSAVAQVLVTITMLEWILLFALTFNWLLGAVCAFIWCHLHYFRVQAQWRLHPPLEGIWLSVGKCAECFHSVVKCKAVPPHVLFKVLSECTGGGNWLPG